jgi:hypothetical protein
MPLHEKCEIEKRKVNSEIKFINVIIFCFANKIKNEFYFSFHLE